MRLTGLGDSRAKRLLKLVFDAPATVSSEPPPAAERVTVDQQGDTLTVEAPRTAVATPEDLLRRANIDERIWQVDRVLLNNYEMGSTPRRIGNDKDGWSREDNAPIVTPLFSLKIWLSRRKDVMNIEQLKADALAEIRAAAPPAPMKLPKPRKDGQLLYMGAHDVHIGAYAAPQETGQAYSTEVAVDLARRTVARLLADASASGPISRILLPVGQDLMHVESSANATTRGTPQDADGRYRVMRRYAYDLMVNLIDLCLTVAPVDVEAVPGNHGFDTDLAIAERLEARFHNHPHVLVRANLHPRPYYEYGCTLLGLTHGNGIQARDLPIIMADEARDSWARTTDHEWLLGHYHKKMTMQFVTTENEYRGVRVRYLPSIKALDYYHAAHGYANVRAMEAYRYDLRDGYVGHHSIKVRSL